MFAAAFDLEAVLGQGREGALEVGDDDRGVAARRHRRRLGRHQVDLRPLAFEPGELAERGGRLDQLEAEQLPELDRALDLGGRDLDPDVVQHQNKRDSRAAATTIAVDQTTASAVISMSRP